MNVAITGASGFIGSVIAKHACEHGHTVTALVRETSNRSHIDQYVNEFFTGTHDDATAVSELIDNADVVIHNSFDWAALQNGNVQSHYESNLRGSINLLEMSDQRHFIYISSIAVHHHMHDRWEGSIDETHPTRPGSLYGACKAAVEAHLWQAHAQRNQQVTAIRPCAVYGIDPNQERSIGWPIVQTIKAGKPYTKLGGGKFVHVDDVAAATVACIDNPKATPNVYNLVDCYARWADWALLAAKEIGCEVEIDQSSPEAPKNTFITTNVANDLGVMLNRGTDGIRKQIQDLINV
jgi:nucleoside-diphosphate-sugar epimerase